MAIRDLTSTPVRAAAALLAPLGLCACAMHWPWTHRAGLPPVAVHEVLIEAPADAGFGSNVVAAQYWDRNTLLLDLTAIDGRDGGLTLVPIAGRGWPVRLEFRVRPGSMKSLEVRGAQRVLFSVPAGGAGPMLLKLDPGAYEGDTPRISLRWSAADDLPR